MRRAAGLLSAALLASSPVAEASSPPPADSGLLECDDGKITKIIAGAKWKMRGCADGYSLLFLFQEKNDKKLAFISVRHGESGYEVSGGGRIDQPEVMAAARWAYALTEPEIAALYSETQAKKKRKS